MSNSVRHHEKRRGRARQKAYEGRMRRSGGHRFGFIPQVHPPLSNLKVTRMTKRRWWARFGDLVKKYFKRRT